MEGSAITGAAEVVHSLEKLDAPCIFGIPGIHNLNIYDYLIHSKLRHITSRNESGAGFMALGLGRVTGKAGIALVITGPGLTNIMTPMAEAYHDCIPMLVISSQIPSALIGGHSRFLHELENSTGMTASISKAAWRIEQAEKIESTISAAYELANSGRPGPVHVEIPLDVLQSQLTGDKSGSHGDIARLEGVSVHSVQDTPSQAEKIIHAAAEKISRSPRIALICGGGAIKSAAEVQKLQELTGALIVTTAAGKGVVAEDNPLSLGTRLHFSGTARLLESMDLVIAVGTQLSATDLWETQLDLGPKLLLINLEEGILQRFPHSEGAIQADAAGVLRGINVRLEQLNMQADERTSMAAEVQAALKHSQMELATVTGIPKGELSRVLHMLKELRAALPTEGVCVTDMTTPAYAAISEWMVDSPGKFLHPVGFGALGYALPAGIGIKAGRPQLPVVVLTGDGGFQFTLQELAVAAEQRQGLPIIIWNNRGYGEIRKTEELRHPGKRIAVDITPPNFELLSAAYGADYRSFASSNLGKVFRHTVQQAFEQNKPTIIELVEEHMEAEIFKGAEKE
ncbi:MAG: thiamine pyrophosphate-binding protein [Spirochaetia bacterium]|nr:thiamine pyrophosphate-binding protein [Spirochaetia bacterium]